MALKDTISTMEKMLIQLATDLKKTIKGNKAAAQRVRTNSVKFAKVAKMFRKQSITEEKKKAKKVAKKKAKRKR